MVYMGKGSWGGRVHPPHLNYPCSFYDVQYGGGDMLWCFTCASIVLTTDSDQNDSLLWGRSLSPFFFFSTLFFIIELY